MVSRRTAWMAAALVAVLLVYAWVDGGEEPLRPIVEPIDRPETAR